MDTVRPVDVALGHSVFRGEMKGDLPAARAAAKAALRRARSRNDPVALANALLAHAAVHLLQGEPGGVLRCVADVERVAPRDAPYRFLATSYSWAASSQRFGVWPDGCGAYSAEIEVRWDPVAALEEKEQAWVALREQVADPGILLAGELIYQLMPNLPVFCSIIEQGRRRGAAGAASIQVCLGRLEQKRERARAAGASEPMLAYIDLVEADLHRRAGLLDDAEMLRARAQATYARLGDEAGVGLCEMTRGDWRAAPATSPLLWNLVIQESGSEGSDPDPASMALARRQAPSGRDIAAARAAYTLARASFAAARAPRGLAALQLRDGWLAAAESDYVSALRQTRAAQAAFAAVGDAIGQQVATAHAALAAVGAHRRASAADLAAIGEWGAGDGSFSIAHGLGLLIGRSGWRWLLEAGDYERALTCFRFAERLYGALGASLNRTQSLVDQGVTYELIGAADEAGALYEEALDSYAAQERERPAVAARAGMRGLLLTVNAFQLYQRFRDTVRLRRVVARLEERLAAPAPSSVDDVVEVIGPLVHSLCAHTFQQGSVLIPLYEALDARDAGDEERAAERFTAALATVRALPATELRWMEASVLAHLHRFDEAADAFRRVLAEGGPGAAIDQAMADFAAQHRPEGAAEEARQAELRQCEMAATFFTRTRQWADANKAFEALAAMSPDWWRHDQRPWERLDDLGVVREALGDHEGALHWYDLGIEILEERRRGLFRDELKTALHGVGPQYLYVHAARAALRLHLKARAKPDIAQEESYAAKAFAYLEQGKARALLDLIASGAAQTGNLGGPDQYLGEWRQASAQLTLWRGQLVRAQSRAPEDVGVIQARLEAAETALHDVEARLASRDPDLLARLNPTVAVSELADVRALLPPDVALVELAFLGDDLLIWAVTRDGMRAAHFGWVDATTLAVDIRAFHHACVAREPIEELGQRLAETLLAPLHDVLDAYDRIVVVPFGAAHVLPFHVLPWKGTALGLSHVVSYLPSASALQFLTPSSSEAAPTVLAVGNPARMSYQPPGARAARPQYGLRGAATEAAFVASLFPGSRLLVGPDATEEGVRAALPEHSILHLATHGVLSQDAPLLSGILLADGEAITVDELMGLRLNADLVVLSACRTGLGQATAGDDVLGLTRGLLAAGARAAVVSLWPVDDLSTTLLMGRLYTEVRAGVPPACALQAAQKYLRGLTDEDFDEELAQLENIRREREIDWDDQDAGAPAASYDQPYYWAPFIMVGL